MNGTIQQRTVAEKMGIRPNTFAFFRRPPDGVLSGMELPPLAMQVDAAGHYDVILHFAEDQVDLDAGFAELKPLLAQRGALWACWPKARQLGTDLTLPEVIGIGYTHYLVESKTLSIDSVWSAMKFTHPIAGKVYRNSYGTLAEKR